MQSGSAALAWWRIRDCEATKSSAGEQLHDAYRLHTLHSAIREREAEQSLAFLRRAGLEPLMGKGWAIARLYPEPGLRPYGDIDLYMRRQHYDAAVAAFRNLDGPRCPVDLHCGAGELDDRSFGDLYERSDLVSLGTTEARLLGVEDHLRLLCVHMLKHGAWRPLWLCDIAAALESRPANFDWDYFLSGDPRRTDWVACAIGLAHRLLGARVEDTPVETRATSLPRWLLPRVLRQWGVTQTPHGARLRMAHFFRHPNGVIEAIRIRWPNAIEATVDVRGPFNELPRLPFQIGDCLLRTAKLFTRLPKSLGWACS